MVVQEGEHRVGHLAVPQRGADDNGIPLVKTLDTRFDLRPVAGIDLAALVVSVVIGRLALGARIVAMVLHLEQRTTALVGNVLSQRLGHPAIGVINNQRANLAGRLSLCHSKHRHHTSKKQ